MLTFILKHGIMLIGNLIIILGGLAMKESVLNTKNLLTATATPNNATTATTPVTTLGSAVGTSNRSGYYHNVPEPMAYDTIRTADGRQIRVESHVIGRDC